MNWTVNSDAAAQVLPQKEARLFYYISLFAENRKTLTIKVRYKYTFETRKRDTHAERWNR